MADCNSMVVSWSQYNPVRVHVGAGLLARLVELVPMGRVLLVTTPGFTARGTTKGITDTLRDRVIVYDKVTPNPDLDSTDSLIQALREESCDSIVALGGGSVIDTAKILSVTLRLGMAVPLDTTFRKGNKTDWKRGLPLIAVPTTAGTGAEVTPFATIWDGRTHAKLSLASESLYPSLALLDPTLTLGLPRRETVSSALDAIAHSLESLWNRNRTPLSEALALKALKLANRALPHVLREPGALEQRTAMQEASLLAGLAISQTKTAVAHAISYPLTAHFGVPHGMACGFTLLAILNLLESRNFGLVGASERHVLADTARVLREVKPDNVVARETSCDAVLARMSEMCTAGRRDNFVMDLDADQLTMLIKESYK